MKENKLWSRILSMLLCAVMVLGYLSGITIPAKAETVTAESAEVVEAAKDANKKSEIVEQEEKEPANEPQIESVPAVRKPAVKSAASLAQGTYTSADGKWSFMTYGEGVQITAYHGHATDIYVPFKVTYNEEDYAVLKLADSLFADNDSLNSVTLGEGILEIGAKTFYDCDNLVCIVTNETLTTIGSEAFYSCDSFNSVILYDAVSTIGENAFAECPKLTIWCNENTAAHTHATANAFPHEILNPNATPETYIQDGITYYIMNGEAVAIDCDNACTNVTIPATVGGYPVTTLRETFKGKTNIKSVILPDSLKTISAHAFEGSGITAISIPDSVTTVGAYAFNGCNSLSAVEFSANMSEIPESCFRDCGLRSVTIPGNIKTVARYAFFYTDIWELTINEGVTYIGDRAFETFRSGYTEVRIPGTVKTIGDGAFSCDMLKTVVLEEGVTDISCAFWSSGITSITLPSTITSLDMYAFDKCKSLTSITIPGTVKSIGYGAFRDCTNLTEVVLEEGIQSIGQEAFAQSGKIEKVLIPKSVTLKANDSSTGMPQQEIFDANTIWLVYEGSSAYDYAKSHNLLYAVIQEGEENAQTYTQDGVTYYIMNGEAVAIDCDNACTNVTIPATVGGYPVTTLRETFKGKTNIKSVILPDSLKTISAHAFEGSGITAISIPDSVTTVGAYAFNGCNSLSAVEFSANMSEIPESCFRDCGLRSVTIPGNIKTVARYAFFYTDIWELTINEGVTYIGDRAFETFRSGYTEVRIPGTVKTIGDGAFSCDMLKTVVLEEGVTDISCAFWSSGITSITLPSTITSLDMYAFDKCKSLTSITIPGTVKSIGYGAFRDCTNLTEVVLEEGIQSIGQEAFAQSGKIEKVLIPKSVTLKANDSSTGMPQQEIFDANTIWLVYEGSSAYDYAKSHNLLYAVIQEGEENAQTYTQDGVTYYIMNGEAVAIDCDNACTNVTIPATVGGYPVTTLRETFKGKTNIKSVILPDSLKTISAHAFEGSGITAISIPDSVTTVGAYAFNGCNSLSAVEFSANMSEIPESCFRDCGLRSVTIPGNIKTVARYAFFYTDIWELTINEGVTYIGDRAFETFRSGYTEVRIPGTVKTIGDGAFSCDMLKTVVLEEGVTDISCAFWSSGITSITLPSTITSLDMYAFDKCKSLTSITIPGTVKSIGYGAFRDCTNLTEVVLEEGIQSIGQEAFAQSGKIEKVLIPKSVTLKANDSSTGMPQQEIFDANTIWLVYEGSSAYDYAKSHNILYFAIQKIQNPEVSFGTGISGTVIYLDGSAASGATVEIFYDDGVLKESVITDANGTYEFTYAEVGAYTIRVKDANGNTASTAVSVKRMNAFEVFLSGDPDLKLKKGHTVSGTVNTYPASITITDENGNVLGSTETTDGNFSFENIPNGTYIITATTENGSVSQEITVFDGNVSDIVLTIDTTAATLWGYVEVEDRELNHHRRNWVEVTVYNADGLAVAHAKTDKDGKYTFTGLPVGEYSIVAQTAEMRPDQKHGFDRSHTLTGYAYIAVNEAGTYQVETIVLREENDHKATISGKVTAHGETQNCQVVLHNVFRSEIASMTTGKNGKYSFKNISDGLYFITATTNSDGMGYAVVVVRNGKVYGETSITVYKTDKVKDREEKFRNDVPHCENRADALQYRDRIAEEKRFYDGLSEKEKKQLSKDYVNRLDQLIQWITDCDIQTGDGVTLEQSGLVISGEEVANAEDITFTLNVTPSQAHNASTDGVHNREDQIHHNINDKSNKHDVLQYYDITLSKEVDGVSTQITSVTKDTETNGKLRVTMEIPEEYRGYKHYTIIHEHCGDVVTLTDLDDDPNTVTFEVKKFSTFVLAGTNITLTEIEDEESSIVESWGLTLTDAIVVNFTMNESALTDENTYVEVTIAGNVRNIPAAEAVKGIRVTLAAAQMMDNIGLCVVDGNGNRSESSSYTVRQYCDIVLADKDLSQYHALVKEMLHYGAMAQMYFNYDTENLADDDMNGSAATAVPETAAAMEVSDQISALDYYGASLVYRDRIAVRYYFTGDMSGMVFTANGNTYTPVAKQGMYYIEVADILPQDLDQQITLTVTDANGNTLIVTYGPMNYIVRMNEKGSAELKNLLKALYNYHLAAKALSA